MPSASGSLMNETRSTRIVALLAGNGFFLAKLGEHWLTEGHRLLPSIMPLVIIALLGVSLAYISLFGRLQKRWPLVLEAISAICFLITFVGWINLAFFYGE